MIDEEKCVGCGRCIGHCNFDAIRNNNFDAGELLNRKLAEYAKAVLPHLAGDATTITCLFGEGVRNGKPIQRSTASKKARGSMVRWMAENKLEDASELTAFNIGYRHVPELSDKNTLVFMNAQAL